MAERSSAARQGRRDRQAERQKTAEELERSAEIKRRSRSEGPNRRIRMSMEVGQGGKKQTVYDGGGGRGRKDLDSPDSDDSDYTPVTVQVPIVKTTNARYESDSDSDRQKWTKNPLIVKKVRKTDKSKQVERRMSGENGSSPSKRDSWTYYAANDDGSSGGSREGTGGKGNKYQRLEEMRKKRINLAVTSDEENTPASRISRLRQRAIQSGLGQQTRASVVAPDQLPGDNVQWHVRQPTQQPQQQSPTKQQPQLRQTALQYQTQSAPHPSPKEPLRQTYVATPVSVTPVAPFSPSQQKVQTYNSPNVSQRQEFPGITKLGPPVEHVSRSHSQQQYTSPLPQSHGNKARAPVLTYSSSQQSFFSGPETSNQLTTRVAYDSSPEIHMDNTPRSLHPNNITVINNSSRVVKNQPIGYSQNPRTAQVRSSLNPPVSQQSTGSKSPQLNEAAEMRLKHNRLERPRSLTKAPKKTAVPFPVSHSEDSLDELIESNIQYLDSEIDKASKAKKLGGNVSRSSSLPDPRRLSNYNSGGSDSQHTPTAVQINQNSSVQFRVELPSESQAVGGLPFGGFGTPVIKLGSLSNSENVIYDNVKPNETPLRKLSYDSRSRPSRPISEYYDRDDMSKSDSNLSAPVVVPSFIGQTLHPDQAYHRGCVSDVNLTSSNGNALQIPQVDKGMFSDVDYDIEVSERVKKWEKYMKVKDEQEGAAKHVSLAPIQEKNEGEPLMIPSEVRKSIILSNPSAFVSTPSDMVAYTAAASKPFSSDTNINRAGETEPSKVFTVETNARKFFQVIQDPNAGPRLGFQSQSVSSVYQTPVAIHADPVFMSANDLRAKILSNRQQAALPSTSGPIVASHQVSSYQLPQSHTDSEISTPVVMRSAVSASATDPLKRGSRYQDELDEISNVKSDTVVSLRKRFDDSTADDSAADEQRQVSTAYTKLNRSGKGDSFPDWTSMVPEYQSRIKEPDVWSPNMESTQGVPVSIERLNARTLQTIPFSEDPSWKEIEEMTSFDPNSMAGHLSLVGGKPIETEIPSQSSTLPSQPRTPAVSFKERLQRSKSLYTPNITPLSIATEKDKDKDTTSGATSALDDVLDDIRTSMERKQHSPKKKATEISFEMIQPSTATTSNSAAPQNRAGHESLQPGFKLEGGRVQYTNKKADAAPQNNTVVQMRAEQKPVQFYKQQRIQELQPQQHVPVQQTQQQQNRQSQMLPSNVNGYQLDPNLLKQKLLNTGLVVETDTDEPANEVLPKSTSFTPYKPTSSVYNPVSTQIISNKSSTQTSQPNTRFPAAVEKPTVISKAHEVSRPAISEPTASIIPSIAPSLFTAPSRSNPLTQNNRPGTSALDHIQQALAPFNANSYVLDPDSPYATTRFTSIGSGFDTTRGNNTESTSWTYKPGEDNDDDDDDVTPTTSTTSTLQKVNESMDDLKNLAQNVERRINVIKTKLEDADETSLDTVLNSLKLLTPGTKPLDSEPESFEAYYTTKRSKLSDALTELDKIYNNLDLNSDSFTPKQTPTKAKLKQYRPSKSNDFILTPQPKSEHLRPMQTRISSMYIPELEKKSKAEIDKETENEFENISKSFQAIVDEVNKTTDMFIKANRAYRTGNRQEPEPDKTAPETQKKTFKITLKPGEASSTVTHTSTAPLVTSSLNTELEKGPRPATAPKPEQSKSRAGRFRSKLQQDFGMNVDPGVKTTRSKSVPDVEIDSTELLLGKPGDDDTSPPKLNVIKTITTTESIPSTSFFPSDAITPRPSSVMSPPTSSKNKTRFRPVRDNKIMQDDRTGRKDGEQLGVSISPRPSPKLSRRIIYNTGTDMDVNIQPPKMFQDKTDDDVEKSFVQSNVKLQAQVLENSKPKRETEIKSPPPPRKIPPPTAAKPTLTTLGSTPQTPQTPAKPRVIIPVSKSSENIKETKTIIQPALTKLQAAWINKAPESPVTASTTDSSAFASAVSSPAVRKAPPPVSSTKPDASSDPIESPTKPDPTDSDTSQSGVVRGKLRMGKGVAKILDRFNENSPEKLKESKVASKNAIDLSDTTLDDTEEDAITDIDIDEIFEDAKAHAAAEAKKDLEKRDSPKPVSRLALRRVSPSPPTVCDAPRSPAPRPLERKITDPELKTSHSGTASPQPSSPNKPPQYPWKRQPSDPEKQIFFPKVESNKLDSQDSSSELPTKEVSSSPKPVSKLAKIVGPSAAAAAAAALGEKPPGSPKMVKRRVRPPNRKIQTDPNLPSIGGERPHSFHELASLQEDLEALISLRRSDRSASVDEVNPEVSKSFRSEINQINLSKPSLPQAVGQAVLKMEATSESS